jgi:hypothetical protein
MLIITIEAETAEEMHEKLQQLAYGFSPFSPKAIVEVVEINANPAPVRRERKAKAEAEASEPEIKEKSAKEQPGADDTSDFMKVKTRCLEVAKVKGREALEKLLDGFGVKRITELKSEEYEAVLSKVDEVLGE